jgi:hypothetical protein
MFKEDFEILKISEEDKKKKYEELIKDLDNVKDNFTKIRKNSKYIEIYENNKYFIKELKNEDDYYDYYDNNGNHYTNNENIDYYDDDIELKNSVIKRTLYDNELKITELELYLIKKYNEFSIVYLTITDFNSFLNLFKKDFNSHSLYKNIDLKKLSKHFKLLYNNYFEDKYNSLYYKKWEFIMIFQYILDN